MKDSSADKKNISSLSSSIEGTLSSEKTVAALKKILLCAAFCILSLLLSGVEVFPGTYPLGLAFLSSVTGPTAVFSSFVGALFGSSRTGTLRGIYVLVYILLTAARVCTSLWLESDKLSSADRPFSAACKNFKNNHALKALASSVFAAAKTRFGSALRENIRIRLALSACAALFAGAWSVIGGGYVYYDLFGAIFSLFTVPLFTYLFYAGMSRNMRASRLREIGIYFVCAAITLALHGMSAVPLSASSSLTDAGIVNRGFFFDFGVAAAFAAAMLVTVSYGTHRGVLCGLMCGAVLTPMYAPAYALGAIVCGFLAPFSQTIGLLVGGALTTAWGIYVGGFDGMALMFPPTVFACALLIPAYRFDMVRPPTDLFLSPSSVKKRGEASAMADLSAADITRRVESISDGLCSVAAVLEGLSEKLVKPEAHDMREIVESVFTFHCSTCKNRGCCAEANAPKGSPLVKKMTDSLAKFGVVTADTVPPSLASECWNMGRILDEINLTAGHKIAAMADGDKLSVTASDYTLAGTLIGTAAKASGGISQIDRKLTEKLRPVIAQKDFSASSVTAYGGRYKHIFVDDVDVNSSKMGADDIRVMFESAAGCRLTTPEFSLDGDDLSMKMLSRPAFSASSGSYSRAASAAVPDLSDRAGSADGVTVEVCDSLPEGICGDVITAFETDGRYYMILSDGMGTGREAALTSGIVVSLLERLIKSGADLECALKMLNHIIRSAGRECSATVDIAEIDLMSGEARFIKSGAAPSFVIRDGSIFRLQSKTVPIGIIRALDAELIRFDIKEGDTVVMVSDGAARSYDEAPWLLDLMTYDSEIIEGDETKAAKKIVAEAKKHGSSDDVTAGIVRLAAQ